jgi:hypothetical protein
MSPNAAAKTLKAEGWYCPKTTVYYIEFRITADLFQAYLKCPMKCWLRAKKSAKPRQETPILNGLNGR